MEEQAIELPPLPPEVEPSEQWRRDSIKATREAFRHYRETMGLSVDDMRTFSAAQIQAYARAAVLQERERCARLADDMDFGMGAIAAAIRSGKPTP
jgi:hypothetical protein